MLVSPTQLAVGSEWLFDIPRREVLAAWGLPARHKRDGANDMYIVPVAMALQGYAKGAGDDAGPKRIVLAVDVTIPLRVLTELTFTAGQVGFSDVWLAVQTDGRYGLAPLSSPPRPGRTDEPDPRALYERLRAEARGMGGARAEPASSEPSAPAHPASAPPAHRESPLEPFLPLPPVWRWHSSEATPAKDESFQRFFPPTLLAIRLRPDSSVEVQVADATVGAGCERLGEGPSVPASGGGVDLDGLSLCLQKLRSKLPALAEVRRPELDTPPNVTVGTYQQLREAIRCAPDGSLLFDDTQAGTVR